MLLTTQYRRDELIFGISVGEAIVRKLLCERLL